MTDEHEEGQAPYARNPLDTRTAEVASALVAVLCVLGTVCVVLWAIGRYAGVW